MKATFALLADNETHNLVRKLSWNIHQKYRTGIDVCRLPPHISLKQPFDISDLDALSEYMTELALRVYDRTRAGTRTISNASDSP